MGNTDRNIKFFFLKINKTKTKIKPIAGPRVSVCIHIITRLPINNIVKNMFAKVCLSKKYMSKQIRVTIIQAYVIGWLDVPPYLTTSEIL